MHCSSKLSHLAKLRLLMMLVAWPGQASDA